MSLQTGCQKLQVLESLLLRKILNHLKESTEHLVPTNLIQPDLGEAIEAILQLSHR